MKKNHINIMTASEFNEKYKEYLEEGHYGLSINDKDVVSFLNSVFIDLTKIPGFKYSQIKSKFGSCRFYSNLQSSSLTSAIESKVTNIILSKI